MPEAQISSYRVSRHYRPFSRLEPLQGSKQLLQIRTSDAHNTEKERARPLAVIRKQFRTVPSIAESEAQIPVARHHSGTDGHSWTFPPAS